MGSFKIDQKFGSSGHPALTKPATRNDGEPPLRAGADLGLGILTNFQVREDQVMQAIHAPESHLAPFCLRFWESTPCCCRSGWNFPFFYIFSVAEINPWLLKGLHQLFQKLHGLYHIGVPVRRWNRTSRDHSLRRKVCLVEPTIIGISKHQGMKIFRFHQKNVWFNLTSNHSDKENHQRVDFTRMDGCFHQHYEDSAG